MHTWICYPKEILGFFFLVGDVAVNLKSKHYTVVCCCSLNWIARIMCCNLDFMLWLSHNLHKSSSRPGPYLPTFLGFGLFLASVSHGHVHSCVLKVSSFWTRLVEFFFSLQRRIWWRSGPSWKKWIYQWNCLSQRALWYLLWGTWTTILCNFQ